MKTIFQYSFKFILLVASMVSAYAHFGSRGPLGGSVNCMTVFDSTVYIGTVSGGVYESTNSKLVAWRARPVGLKSGKITAIVHTGKYLFAGTADSGVFRFTGFVGVDRYWETKNSGLGSTQIIALISVDSVTLLASTVGGGLFKTVNKGESWIAVNNPTLENFDISSMAKAGNRIVVGTQGGGIYVSDDTAKTWKNFNDNGSQNSNVALLSYNEKTDELIVTNEVGMYLVGNAGQGSTAVYTLAENGLPNGTKVISISNNQDNWYIATNMGLFTSSASALNWVSIGTVNLENLTAIVPFRTNLVLGTKDLGIYKTTLASASPTTTWTSVSTGFNNQKAYAVATSGQFIIAAATEKGVFISKDLASSYVKSNNGLEDSLNVTDLLFLGSNLYASTANAGIFFSADTGRTWNRINTGLVNKNIQRLFRTNNQLVAFDNLGNVLATSTSTINWASRNSGLPIGVQPRALTFVNDTVILGTFGTGVFVNVNGLETGWSAANAGLDNLEVTSLTSFGPFVFAGTAGNGVFRAKAWRVSQDGWQATAPLGISHTNLMGLNGSHIQAMATNGGYVFASHKGGLLATSDHGNTWIAGGNQFNLPSYADIYRIDFTTNTTGRVFVTTPNNSIYSNALSELPALPTGLFNSSENNASNGIKMSPNPNSGSFCLKIEGRPEKIEIVNTLGEIVKELPSLSEQNVEMDTKGMFLIRANTKNGLQIQKLIVE